MFTGVNHSGMQRFTMPTGHVIVTDLDRGVGLIADPPDSKRAFPDCGGHCPLWDLTIGF
jgi:hypothetical protein